MQHDRNGAGFGGMPGGAGAAGARSGRAERPARGRRIGGRAVRRTALLGSVAAFALACNPGPSRAGRPGDPARPERVRPGISVLLGDSLDLVRDKRIGLITNRAGVDERGRSTIDLLASDPRARAANVQLVRLFSPEHGIRGTEDRTELPDGRDETTGLPIISLYGRSTVGPPDSLVRDLDAIVVDLPDIGTRTWTYTGIVLYTLQVAARTGTPVIVLDRPNPIRGDRVEGATLDSSLADARESTPGAPRNGFALWPMPLRHGLTMGELARLFRAELDLATRLHVVPVAGWQRDVWFDETKLPWVPPSPNLPTPQSALLYPALVPFEGTNVSVGRGTEHPFEQVGAPWLDADSAAALLAAYDLPGVRFEATRFTPSSPGDRKFDGITVAGVRVIVTDRNRVQVSRTGAALLWAVARLGGDDFVVDSARVDLRLGSPAMRRALLQGGDPDVAVDQVLPAVVAWEQFTRRYRLYR